MTSQAAASTTASRVNTPGSKTVTVVNREQWLTDVAKQVEPVFHGFLVPPYRVTCGWPTRGAVSTRRRVVGQCHGAKSSSGGLYELFISPVLAEPLEVAGTLCHELAHVAAGTEAGHGGKFVKVCRHVGLDKGKPTNVMPGDRLNDRLRKIIEVQGAYPHSAIVPILKQVKVARPAVRLECEECGCKVSMSAKWYAEAGAPTCACGGVMAWSA